MSNRDEFIEKQYTVTNLSNAIFGALERSGKRVDTLTPSDLAAVDEFHIRGREATRELAELAQIDSTLRVLDVGCGLGGSARYLVSEYGCHVVGLDLTEEYCQVAKMLSGQLGLAKKTEFHYGSALDIRFPSESFDTAWTEHTQMNVENKQRFYAEIYRVLKRGGRLAFHDIFQGKVGEPHFPVPWADEASLSSLIAPDELQSLLEAKGFRTLHWRDMSSISLEWFRQVIERIKSQGSPPLGLHLLMGSDAGIKFQNSVRNLDEGRIIVIQAVLEKAA